MWDGDRNDIYLTGLLWWLNEEIYVKYWRQCLARRKSYIDISDYYGYFPTKNNIHIQNTIYFGRSFLREKEPGIEMGTWMIFMFSMEFLVGHIRCPYSKSWEFVFWRWNYSHMWIILEITLESYVNIQNFFPSLIHRDNVVTWKSTIFFQITYLPQFNLEAGQLDSTHVVSG